MQTARGSESPSARRRERAIASGRRRLTGLLARDVVSIPVGPILVVTAGTLLVLSMGYRRATQGRRHVGFRGKCHVTAFHAPGESRRDLLQQPAL